MKRDHFKFSINTGGASDSLVIAQAPSLSIRRVLRDSYFQWSKSLLGFHLSFDVFLLKIRNHKHLFLFLSSQVFSEQERKVVRR